MAKRKKGGEKYDIKRTETGPVKSTGVYDYPLESTVAEAECEASMAQWVLSGAAARNTPKARLDSWRTQVLDIMRQHGIENPDTYRSVRTDAAEHSEVRTAAQVRDKFEGLDVLNKCVHDLAKRGESLDHYLRLIAFEAIEIGRGLERLAIKRIGAEAAAVTGRAQQRGAEKRRKEAQHRDWTKQVQDLIDREHCTQLDAFEAIAAEHQMDSTDAVRKAFFKYRDKSKSRRRKRRK